jgi:hypothetical protein
MKEIDEEVRVGGVNEIDDVNACGGFVQGYLGSMTSDADTVHVTVAHHVFRSFSGLHQYISSFTQCTHAARFDIESR